MMLERSGAQVAELTTEEICWELLPTTPGRSRGQKQRALSEEGLAVEVLPFSEYAAAPNLLEGDGFAV